MSDAEFFEIEVTGELPLEFEGEEIYDNSSHYTNSQENNRWHQITIYKAQDKEGKYYVLNLKFKTLWQGEPEISEAWELNTIEEVAEELNSYDPIIHLRGYPDGEHFEAKQEKLKAKLTFDWKQLKVEALKSLGIKRETRGRKSLGDRPKVSFNLKIDPNLKAKVKELGINASSVLEEALAKKIEELTVEAG